MDEGSVARWLVAAALVFFCALLSCAQAALTNVNEGRLRDMKDNGRAKKLLPLLERPEPVIALRGLRTLFLFLLVGAGACALKSRAGWAAADSVLVAALIASPAAMVLCKLAPEMIGKCRSEKAALALCPLILFVYRLMTPFTWLEQAAARGVARLFGVDPNAREEVTEEEIQAMMDIGEESGVIESGEHEMLKNVFEFGELTAADCMTHRTDVTAIWIQDDEETIRNTIKESGLSRFPVYDEDIDDIVGVLSTREYLLNAGEKQPKPLKRLLREAYFVPETVKTDVLLRNMQRAKTHIAIVVDEYGGMSGIVTMEDLLEEIVGNIYDEFDPTAEVEVQPLGDNVWRVSGMADLETVEEAVGVSLPRGEDYDTLGGLIFSRFSTIPEDGSTPSLTLCLTPDGEEPEEGDCGKVKIEVESIVDRRVEWAKLTLLPAGGQPPAEHEETAQTR